MTIGYLYSARQICRSLHISLQTLNRWVASGKFDPPDLRIHQRYWKDVTLEHWLAENRPPDSGSHGTARETPAIAGQEEHSPDSG